MSADVMRGVLADLPAAEQASLEHLFVTFEPQLRRLARRSLSPFLRTQLDSQDLVQSVWVHFLKGRTQANWNFADGESLRAFLCRVLRNRLVDHARRMKACQQREQSVSPPETRPGRGPSRPSELAQANEQWDRIQALCPEQHRPILDLKRQGLSLDEIAARTSLHPSSIRRILYGLAKQLALQPDVAGRTDACE